MKPQPLSNHSHVLLIGSPVHFVDELESDHFRLTHAWPLYQSTPFEANPESPLFHAFFTISFDTVAADKKSIVIPDFTIVGHFFCVFLSVFFGKKFKNLGAIQSNGHHCIPDVATIEPCRRRELLPLSSKPRKDLGIELNLRRAECLLPILNAIFLEISDKQEVAGDIELAYTAGRFYLEALSLFETDAELAYLSLVNAGEVLVSGLTYSESELFDESIAELLKEVEVKIGKDAMQKIRSRLFQVRRKFRFGLSRLISQPFFNGHEPATSAFVSTTKATLAPSQRRK